ncbi:uncharacterized protein EV154DRAFT_517978 [Mucor mucedo]|uniref:uncharacterized protein n=1 Tax=Mucor mucedo TaxID=29922 RepID=UPI002220422E|nr:uncharacterized protein EV154DRAFT_517978 [Mucor mucedo]KAI7888333.1 hypothetical protein EV154DRAFT_517978 [Mucor mucedo]
MKYTPTILFSVTLLGVSLAAETMVSRSFPSCAYVGGQIYCFGGDTYSDFASGNKIDQNIYSLDIAKFSGNETDTLSSKWEKMIPKTTFNLESRRAPTAAVLPDGKSFMIVGGLLTSANQKFSNQTIIYDTATNTWIKGLSCTEPNRGTRQVHRSTAVNLPDNMIGFYGGLEQAANTSLPEITASGKTMNYTSTGGSLVGFRAFKVFSLTSNSWYDFSPQANIPADYYPNTQSATIIPSTGKVYYFGGSYYTPDSLSQSIRVPFDKGNTFDTKAGSWSQETFTGDIPSNRLFHSTNLLPNSDDIILYGGSNDGAKATTDYCYTLNILENKWTRQDFYVPTSLSGPRFSHSTVLVNSTLFVLFGRGLDGSLNPSMLTLNVADATKIAYTSVYRADGQYELEADETHPPAASTGLSTGATAGIGAGCGVLGLGIIAFIIFYMRRQKKKKTQQHQQLESDIANEQLHDPIHVDWDKIDNDYREVDNLAYTRSPQLSENTTQVNSPLSGAAAIKHVPHTPEPTNMEVQPHMNKNPDAMDEVELVKPSAGISIVKPDGYQ